MIKSTGSHATELSDQVLRWIHTELSTVPVDLFDPDSV
jgi:hypothetical protein